jgi:hypothetical protein
MKVGLRIAIVANKFSISSAWRLCHTGVSTNNGYRFTIPRAPKPTPTAKHTSAAVANPIT